MWHAVMKINGKIMAISTEVGCTYTKKRNYFQRIHKNSNLLTAITNLSWQRTTPSFVYLLIRIPYTNVVRLIFACFSVDSTLTVILNVFGSPNGYNSLDYGL